MKRRLLEQHLRDHGCRLFLHGARHDLWLSQSEQERAAIPRHAEIKLGTARNICRQLGVSDPPGR